MLTHNIFYTHKLQYKKHKMLLCNTYTIYPSRFKRPFNKGKREKIKESILLRGIS